MFVKMVWKEVLSLWVWNFNLSEHGLWGDNVILRSLFITAMSGVCVDGVNDVV